MNQQAILDQIEEARQSFVLTEQKEFETRYLSVQATKIVLKVSGRDEPIEGNALISENTTNPNPLEVSVIEGNVQKSPDTEVLFVSEGTIQIGSDRSHEALERFSSTKGELQELPPPQIRDPDITTIDGKTLRQTGTLQLKVVDAIITL